jgi:hypothetical protein
VDEFLIPSAAGSGGLRFYGRSPADGTKTIEEFWVQLTDHNLSASGQVYVGYVPSSPALLFADMARQWAGWSGALVWESLEEELSRVAKVF